MYGLNLRKDKIKLCVSHGIRTVSVTKYTSAQRKHLTCYSITYLQSSWDLGEVGLYHEHLNHFKIN
jgi:hypothetical protein